MNLGCERLNLISVHAPDTGRRKQKRDNFYGNLQKVIDAIRKIDHQGCLWYARCSQVNQCENRDVVVDRMVEERLVKICMTGQPFKKILAGRPFKDGH